MARPRTQEVEKDGACLPLTQALSWCGCDVRNEWKDQEIPYDAEFTYQGHNQNMLFL